MGLLLLPLVGSCASSPEPQACVRSKVEQNASLPATVGDAPCEDAHVPADYGEFTRMPSYPRTLKVWKDGAKLGAKGPRHVVIDLKKQRGVFIINGEIVMDFPVCTGTKRKPTPRGTFRITQKDVDHVSNIYDVPMPYFMRLTDYGIGLHVGDVFRTPASHGCIRMTPEACVPLYRHAPSGTRVVVK